MNEGFEPYIDEYGLLVGSKEDPGDSLHRTCMALLGKRWFGKMIRTSIIPVINGLETSGKWVRHPSKGWWSDTDRLSRDQATPLVIILSENNLMVLLKEFLLSHIKNFFFFTNTRRNGATKENHGTKKWDSYEYRYNYNWKVPDWITLEFLGIYIRAFDAWWLYPGLLVTDLETLFGSVLWKFRKSNDVLNHMIVCEYFTRKYPTPWSWLARMINSRHAFNVKLYAYFDRVGLKPMADLWRI